MIKPIKKVEDINPELIFKMTRECINIEWIKDFYTGDKEELFTMIINKDWTVIVRSIVLDQLHHEDIAKRVAEIMGGNPSFAIIHRIYMSRCKTV